MRDTGRPTNRTDAGHVCFATISRLQLLLACSKNGGTKAVPIRCDPNLPPMQFPGQSTMSNTLTLSLNSRIPDVDTSSRDSCAQTVCYGFASSVPARTAQEWCKLPCREAYALHERVVIPYLRIQKLPAFLSKLWAVGPLSQTSFEAEEPSVRCCDATGSRPCRSNFYPSGSLEVEFAESMLLSAHTCP